MDIRKTRTCEKCKSTVTLDKVRLYPKNPEQNWVVCEPCCEQLRSKGAQQGISNMPKKMISPPISNKVITRYPGDLTKPFQAKNIGNTGNTGNKSIRPVNQAGKSMVSDEGKEARELQSMTCTRCKYRFKVDSEKAGVQYRLCCPYCGKDDRLNQL